MTDYIDLQYATNLSNKLDRYKIKSTNPLRINFRCPICNDSQKDKNKSRGWILDNGKNSLRYHCFNCGSSLSFRSFLKTVDPYAYNNYITAKFKQTKPIEEPLSFNKPVFKDKGYLKTLKKISQLSHDHPVKQYISKRIIPTKEHYRLYYAPKFMTWVNTIIPNKFPNITKDEPRLILPFLDENGILFGVSARGFNPNGLRYITIMFDDTKSKIFGLDKVKTDKPYIIVEGAIDSLFLNNSIAMAGADVTTNLSNIENAYFTFDNEPRNLEIHKRMEKLIKQGHKVCIWPNWINGKDINEMVLNGHKDIDNIIYTNSFTGLEAQLRLMNWRKT